MVDMNEIVLSCGNDKVSMPEKLYVSMLSEHGVKPPTSGQHSTLAVLWLSQSAKKRGLTDLAQALKSFHEAHSGDIALLRRPDGSPYTPKVVTTVKVARDEREQKALAAEVAAYFEVE
ncbi:MAG TPA: hypothetical protein VH092_18050 [Urbifossiella sp.]|jgi:hypothetical protein|nr:hypothetical protein [Urbifossiella sp.]